MNKLLLLLFVFLSSAIASAREFENDNQIQMVLNQVMDIKRHNVIDPLMLYYVFFDSDVCQSCNDEVRLRWKSLILQRMCGAQNPNKCERFRAAYKEYSAHLAEVVYQYQFTGDDYYQSNAPFARSAAHILQKQVMVGCDDAAKAFIQLAIEAGYSGSSMKIVFAMAETGFENACENNMGHEARRWSGGGHTMVAVRRKGDWVLVNTTSPTLDYVNLSSVSTRLSKIEMPSLTTMPFGILMAGIFQPQTYLEPFFFNDVKNIYVSGSPSSSICRE